MTAIEISFEIHEGGIWITLYKLLNGQIPDIFEESRNLCGLEMYLAILHQKKRTPLCRGGEIVKKKDITAFLKRVSKIIQEELDEFLKGGFKVFDEAVHAERDSKK